LKTNLKCARFAHQECVLNAIPTAFKVLVPKVPSSAVAAPTVFAQAIPRRQLRCRTPKTNERSGNVYENKGTGFKVGRGVCGAASLDFAGVAPRLPVWLRTPRLRWGPQKSTNEPGMSMKTKKRAFRSPIPKPKTWKQPLTLPHLPLSRLPAGEGRRELGFRAHGVRSLVCPRESRTEWVILWNETSGLLPAY